VALKTAQVTLAHTVVLWPQQVVLIAVAAAVAELTLEEKIQQVLVAQV
jgi:hypothetical protein